MDQWLNNDPRDQLCHANREYADIIVVHGNGVCTGTVCIFDTYWEIAMDGIPDLTANDTWPDHWLWAYHPRHDKYGLHRYNKEDK